jgi:aminoglycoside phosphotransferase (APT) family kinase protein
MIDYLEGRPLHGGRLAVDPRAAPDQILNTVPAREVSAVTDPTLDIENKDALLRYLHRHGYIARGEEPEIHILSGGVSNRTVLVRWSTGESWVLKQALPRLRVQVEWFSDPTRIRREAAALRWLPKQLPQGSVPAFVFEDPAENLLAMQAIPEPHENWKQVLLRGEIHVAHVQEFGRILAAMHNVPSAMQDEMKTIFGDRSFFESLRVEPYYAYTATQLPLAAPFLRALIEEVRATQQTLVHGDYSPKNVLVRQNRLILLDFEVIHYGDPAFDVGFALAHFLSKAHHTSSIGVRSLRRPLPPSGRCIERR